MLCREGEPSIDSTELCRQPALAACATARDDLPDVARQRSIAAERPAEHGKEEDETLGDRRIIGGDVQHQEDVDDQHQDIGADDGADRPTATAAQARAADDDRREELKQHGIADQRIARAGLRRDKHAGEAIARVGEHIDGKLDARYANAGRARRFRIAADGVDRDSEPRRLKITPQEDEDRENDERHRQDAGNRVPDDRATERRRNRAARLLHHEQRHALDDEHCRQGHDDRLEPHHGDEEAVEEPRRDADADPNERPLQHRCGIVLHVGREYDVDQRDDRPSGEIEAARQHDQRLADRSDREGRPTARQEAQLEIIKRAGADEIGDAKEDGKDGNRYQQAAVPRQPQVEGAWCRGGERAAAHGAIACDSAPPRATFMIAASDISSSASSVATRPR